MTTLRPARVWAVKRLSKKRGGSPLPSGVVDQWYPAPASLEFLEEGDHKKGDLTDWYVKTIQRCRDDVNTFLEFVMDVGGEWEAGPRGGRFLRQAWFHLELQELLNKAHRDPVRHKDHRHVAICIPRGHGKTVQVAVGRALWELGRNPNLRVKIVCNTPGTAEERLSEIREHIEHNGYLHAVFPGLKPAEGKQWNNSKLYVERSLISKDPSVSGHGILGASVGGRCDLLIGDDVVDPTTALLSPAMRPKVKKAWWSGYMPQLTRTGRSWYLCTPWHKDDLSHELVTRSQYITFLVHIGGNEESVWPELASQEDLRDKEELMGAIEFARAYRLEAASEYGSPIPEAWIHYFDPESVALDTVVQGLSIDLAVGKQAGDFFVVGHFAVDMKNQIVYVLGYYQGRIPYPEQKQKAREWSHRVRPNWIVVETVAYQEVFADELREDPEMGVFAGAVYKYKPRVSKRARLEAVSPWFKDGSVRFARRLSMVGGAKPDMVRQIVDFGIEPNDDAADTVTQFILFLHERLGFWTGREEGVTASIIGRGKSRLRRRRR